MMACRTASIVAFGALFTAGVIGACREPVEPSVPPVTTAHPTVITPLNPPPPQPRSTAMEPDPILGDGGPMPVMAPAKPRGQIVAAFVDAAKKIDAQPCARMMVAVVKGTVKVTTIAGKRGAGGAEATSKPETDTLAANDVLVLKHPNAVDLNVNGLAVQVTQELDDCQVLSKPAAEKGIVRGKETPELKWANGTMKAHLDVGMDLSPDLYLGRLEGTAAVAEHVHVASTEIVVAIEAAGTFTLDGKPNRLIPRQVVIVPPNTKHAWQPDPGSKLIAIQLYDPPGPEQRFRVLADAGPDPRMLQKTIASSDLKLRTPDAGK